MKMHKSLYPHPLRSWVACGRDSMLYNSKSRWKYVTCKHCLKKKPKARKK